MLEPVQNASGSLMNRHCGEAHITSSSHQRDRVHRGEAGGGAELDGEVAVTDGVQRVGGRVIETERRRGHRAVHREGGAGKRRTAQGRDVDPFAAVSETVPVPVRHLEPCHQVMREGDGLRGLQVCETRHHGVYMVVGQVG